MKIKNIKIKPYILFFVVLIFFLSVPVFAETSGEFFGQEANGESYNFFFEWNIELTIAAWIIAFAIGCIIVLIWKKGMNTVAAQTHACGYVIPGSLNYNTKTDRFLYSTVSKTRRQSQSSSGSGIGSSSGGRISGRRR
jgi:uncharacterized protein